MRKRKPRRSSRVPGAYGSRTNPRTVRKLSLAVYEIEAQKIADRCGVTVTTVKGWLSGKTQMPHSAKALLEVNVGQLDRKDESERRARAHQQLKGLRLHCEAVAALRAAEALEDQPLPPSDTTG